MNVVGARNTDKHRLVAEAEQLTLVAHAGEYEPQAGFPVLFRLQARDREEEAWLAIVILFKGNVRLAIGGDGALIANVVIGFDRQV